MSPVAAGARAGMLYGALAFLAGGLLGPAREVLLAPRLGGLPAALAEAAAMMLLLWLAAGLALGRVRPPAGGVARGTMAAVALGLVLLAELALGALLDATGLAAQRAPRSGAEQAVGLALLAWLALPPFLRRRRDAAAPTA